MLEYLQPKMCNNMALCYSKNISLRTKIESYFPKHIEPSVSVPLKEERSKYLSYAINICGPLN